ncbi:MAG: heme-binding protein [Planctomycetota bacterium]|jgi:hypothetical protein|nr:MAG: heme-binding protein [Planctomycetota bacterium]
MNLKLTGAKMVYAAILILLLTLIVGWKLTARSSYESADYSVLESDGPLEVRAYPDLMLVTTGMKSRGNNGSFGRLFRYISGGNDMAVKVAMTTPVFMEPEGRDTEGQMGFVVPVNVAANQIPNPTDGAVQIQKRAGGRFGVIRFSGEMGGATMAANEEKLRQWITARGFTASESVEFAGYDPPWTPNPFRRNEILIRLH